MDSKVKALEIIQQAEEKAEAMFQKAVGETLPRQLAKTPKDEHRDEIRRLIHKLKEQTAKVKFRLEDGRRYEYSPAQIFQTEERTPDELAAALAGWLRDAADGLLTPLSNEPAAIQALSEQMFNSRYTRHLVGLLDGPATTPQAQGKDAPPAEELTFEGLFQFGPDFGRAMKLIEAPLPDESNTVKAGKWVYSGKSEKALLIAFADVLKDGGSFSIHPNISANKVAQVIAAHFGVEWPEKAYRARWKEGVKKKGFAYDYTEFRNYFLTKM